MPASEPLSVSGLLAQARQGDARALDRLFGMCRNYVAIIARTQVESRLRAKVDASDLVQQTLLEAYRDFPRFQGATEAEWLGWLKRILTHNAADFIRRYHQTDKRQAAREVALVNPNDSQAPDGLANIAGDDETPSQALLRKERELQLADALARLSPDHCEVIVLRNLQRLSFDEVAQRMERSRPATQMLWMRAIHKLQEVMAGDVSGSGERS
jgi:RNA polymerase sigma-70 factor (ECF subfamily)